MRHPGQLIGAAVCAVAVLISACSSSNTGTGHASTPAPTPSSSATTTPAPPTQASTTAGSPSLVPPSTSAAPSTPATPGASLSAFTGSWTGHSRSVTITSSHVGTESVGDGCCDPLIDLTYTLTDPVAAASGAQTATITLTKVVTHPGYAGSGLGAAPAVGATGTLTLVGGVLTDSFTQSTYCDPAEEAKGTCGA